MDPRQIIICFCLQQGYQFWTKTDDEGRFLIKNILAGKYDIYAWVHGFIGDYKSSSTITVTPGQ
jgi:rhamnogalacturonan endolyase